MSFPFKQKYRPAMSHEIEELELVTLETGEVVTRLVNQCKKLPDPDMFDLSNILASGVKPEEVQTKILHSKSVNADKVLKKSTIKKSTTKKQEVNNEN